ncbi:hypothetical protein H5410_004012 [Solanum commersonii]|uniref:Uncharacterized protein n=1 Tax=Solanum commersonii TaxID=4109 RepID=A0A9J6B792_SOLCO|nr:hypothetical protein H5410_004012 [Solanum commersonii]
MAKKVLQQKRNVVCYKLPQDPAKYASASMVLPKISPRALNKAQSDGRANCFRGAMNVNGCGGRNGGVLKPKSRIRFPLRLHLFSGASSQSCEIWNKVVEKCEMKLARWKSQYLSRGGRLTLINLILDSLPTYMMSVFPIPQIVIDRLDKIIRKNLWQGNSEKKSYNLVKWDVVTVGKRQGRLGIKNLKNQNKALRMKWPWRFCNEINPTGRKSLVQSMKGKIAE